MKPDALLSGGAHVSQGTHAAHACPPRHAQFAASVKLEQAIKANLRGLGYGG